MKLSKTIFTTAAAATFLTAAATAQEIKYFDGAYGGIEAGIDWTKLATDTERDRSIYYGGVLGYRVQTDNDMVLGLEGTFGDSGYKNDTTGANSNYEIGASLTLGQAFGTDGSNLVYGKAGYVRARFDPTSASDDAYNDTGWRFGGGYERALNDNMSLRLGGDYTTYGDDKNGWRATAGLIAKF